MRAWSGKRPIAVGAVALVVGLVVLVGFRKESLRELADYHGDLATTGLRISASGVPEAYLSAKQIAYHARLQKKYERAAARPWWPVWPDPPEP